MRRVIVMDKLHSASLLTLGRLRALILRLRGATLNTKTTLGPRCQVTLPYCLTIGRRVTIEDSVSIKIVSETASCDIGNHVFIGKGVVLNIQQGLTIGSHVLIAPGVVIVDHDHSIAAERRIDQQPCAADAILIEDDVWIAANAVVLKGVHIGKGAVIGAGAVVSRNVEAMSIVAGVPAKKIGDRRPSINAGDH